MLNIGIPIRATEAQAFVQVCVDDIATESFDLATTGEQLFLHNVRQDRIASAR